MNKTMMTELYCFFKNNANNITVHVLLIFFFPLTTLQQNMIVPKKTFLNNHCKTGAVKT